jgi:hypothetical protein
MLLTMTGDQILKCVECGVTNNEQGRGWAAYRCDDPERDEAPALAIYCPVCVLIEFGDQPKIPREDDRRG